MGLDHGCFLLHLRPGWVYAGGTCVYMCVPCVQVYVHICECVPACEWVYGCTCLYMCLRVLVCGGPVRRYLCVCDHVHICVYVSMYQ